MSIPKNRVHNKIAAYCLLVVCYLFTLSTYGQQINRAEYFVDADPGNGNATPVAVTTPGTNVNFNFNVSTTSLSNGFHVLGLRMRESVTGRWSHAQYNSFYIVPPVVVANATNVVAGEYFFNADPGNDNGTSFPFTSAASVTVPLNISVGSLAPGFHTISFRLKDDKGKWTHAHAQSFYIVPPAVSTTAVSLKQVEYFFDTDPGNGNGTPLTITIGSPQNNNFLITLPGTLTPGFHKVGFRYRDNLNRWTHAESRSFYIVNTASIAATEIVAAEYYVDDALGSGSPTSISGIIPSATFDQVVALDMTGVPTGPHTLSIRIKDSAGLWSYLETENFTVSSCTPPASPTAASVSRCNAGLVTLTATGASGAQEYRWYDDPILTNLLFTGASFTTPSLGASQIYYVSIYDPATSCESSRVGVNANVTIIPKPNTNPSGNISFCEGGSIFLSAPSGFNQYSWSNGQTTQQILVTTTGNYTVQTGDGMCLSQSSETVSVTTIPSPAKPVITVTGNTTICGTGSVDLSARNGFEYVWSNGSTTQTITVNQTGVFFLIVKTPGANCPSLPSDPVVVNVLTPPCGGGNPTNLPPVINLTPLASQIEGKVEVDLTNIVSDPNNDLDFSTLRVVNNVTSRGATAFVDESFFLQIDYSGNPFTGIDRITVEVCDLTSLCVQQVLDVEVVGEILVFNGITPDNDGYNDFMLIKYVDVVEGASQNKVTILNRWGDVVWDINDYNNTNNVFIGESNGGTELPSGTYFYKVELASGKLYTGYITLKR